MKQVFQPQAKYLLVPGPALIDGGTLTLPLPGPPESHALPLHNSQFTTGGSGIIHIQ